jgi:hypothetical protein
VGVLAAGNTAAAEDALGGIPDDGRGQLIHGNRGLAADVPAFTGTGDAGNMEQLTLTVLVTLLAVNIVVGKQQFHGSPAGLGGFGAGDDHFHTLVYRVDTGGNQTSGTFDLHQADAAGTVVALTVIKCTQRGNFVATLFGSFQDGQDLFHLIGNAFDLNIYHFSFPPYFL